MGVESGVEWLVKLILGVNMVSPESRIGLSWVMCPYAVDGSWMAGRTDSPWYQTMTLFRQTQDRAWIDRAEYTSSPTGRGEAARGGDESEQ